jgi:hypothetical protein
MVAIFAEIAASEAAIIAAEAAAAEAAQIAAAEAAATAAAEATAQQAAQAAAQQAAQQSAQAGISQVGGATANAPLSTAADVQAAAMQSGLPPGFDQQLQNIQNMSQGPSVQVASSNPGAGLDSLRNVSAPPNTSPYSLTSPTNLPAGPAPMTSYELSAPASNTGIKFPNMMSTPAEPPSALMKGLKSASDWASAHPFQAATVAYTGANALGLLNPSGNTFNDKEYDGPLTKYRLADNFQAGSANPEDFQYTPRRYAEGGVMSAVPYSLPVGYNSVGQMPEAQGYAKGGSLSDSIDSYQKMLSGKQMEAPAASRDVGIYYDQDPDTRYQDAFTAAQIRQAKVNQRAYVSPPVAKRPTPMGQLQMASVKPRKQGDSEGRDVEAAQGGIMHSSLGGYAAGGNPRLLRGPGDGMSDNIPATINGRQPARLADGEFVIPADVVSHMGNGSTEAGAKQLHGMMDKVRKARTGNPKQGKNINPKKYMPK